MRFVPSFSPLPLIVNLQYILPMNLTIYQQNCLSDQSPSYKTDYTHNCYKSWLDNFWFIMGLKRSKCFVCGRTFGSGQVTWLCLLLVVLSIGQVHNYLLHYRHLLKFKKQKVSWSESNRVDIVFTCICNSDFFISQQIWHPERECLDRSWTQPKTYTGKHVTV